MIFLLKKSLFTIVPGHSDSINCINYWSTYTQINRLIVNWNFKLFYRMIVQRAILQIIKMTSLNWKIHFSHIKSQVMFLICVLFRKILVTHFQSCLKNMYIYPYYDTSMPWLVSSKKPWRLGSLRNRPCSKSKCISRNIK